MTSRLLVALGLGLLGLDLARPYLGSDLRPWQCGVALSALVVLGHWLHGRGCRGREALPWLALAAFLVPTYLDHSRNLESDGIGYYTYLRSVLFDHDLELQNDYSLLGVTMKAPNVLPVGAPILWSPLVLAVHVLSEGARLFGAAPPTGVEPIYQDAVCLATFVYTSAGLFLLLHTLRRWSTAGPAFWATLICWIGSPLRFYLSVLPSLAHGCEFFAAVVVLRTTLALRDRADAKNAALAGAACGLAFLVRSQDGILLALPLAELALGLRGRAARRPRAIALLAAAGAFLAAALPQLVVWQVMFGTPVLIPHKVIHGAAFMHLDQPQLYGTLFSPRGGLFSSYPAMLLAVLGLFLLAFRDARYVLPLVPVLLAGWYVNSSVFDWYHVRRFTGLVPFLAPGLARVLTPLAHAGLVPMALLAFFVLRYDLAVDGLRALPGDPAPVRAAVAEVADGLARDGYRVLEPRAPRLAVALLSSYTGERLLGDVVTRLDLASEDPALRLPERARNLSAITAEAGVACRWVEGPDTRFFLPLVWNGEVVVTVRARPLETVATQAVEAFWNDQPVGREEMKADWTDYRFHVPPAFLRHGTNVLVLRFDRLPIYRRVRGEGPHQVRPAALAWITLHRDRE